MKEIRIIFLRRNSLSVISYHVIFADETIKMVKNNCELYKSTKEITLFPSKTRVIKMSNRVE